MWELCKRAYTKFMNSSNMAKKPYIPIIVYLCIRNTIFAFYDTHTNEQKYREKI